MSFILRDYQQECVDTIIEKFKELDSQLVQLPTGSGKTIILWHFLKAIGKSAVIIAPSNELTEQLYDTGCDVIGEKDIYLKNKSYFPVHMPKYLIMTNASAISELKIDRKKLPIRYEYLIIDEAHKSQAKMNSKLIENYKNHGVKILGLTATPERLDGKSLLNSFQELTFSRNIIDLIKQNHLVDIICFQIKTEMKIPVEIRSFNGDFLQSILKYLDTDERNKIIIDTYQKYCQTKKTLIFCLTISHAKKINDILKKKGVNSGVVYGEMPKERRKSIINAYRNGDIDVLCNCQILTEGFDDPGIENIIISRPTKSKALFCQMIGRGLRPYPNKKSCNIYNMGDNIHNIVSFNVLGNKDKLTLAFGENLTSAIERNKNEKPIIKGITYEWKKVKIDAESNLSVRKFHLLAFQYYGIPTYNFIELTEKQKNLLIFKSRLLEEYGYDPRTYWGKWKENLSRPD